MKVAIRIWNDERNCDVTLNYRTI